MKRTQFMKQSSLRPFLFYICFLIFFGNACKVQDPSWDTAILAPLVKTKLSISNIVDQEKSKTDSSGVVHLVYSNKLYDLAIDSFFTFSDTSLRKTFRIDSLSLYTTSFDYPLSLGTLARNAGPIGQLLLLFHGFQQTIPDIPNVSSAPIEIKADTFFQTMTLEQGSLDISLYNGLPIDVTNVVFQIRNVKAGDVVVSGEFPLIAAGTTESKSFDLSGKTVEGILQGQLVKLSSPGSKGVPVLIDTTNFINAKLTVSNLHPLTATALWPAQNLINDSYYFGIEGLNVELKESLIGSGKAKIILTSTLKDSTRFTYRLPTATKDGKPFEKYILLSPAPPGGVSTHIEEESMEGYHFDFSGANNDSFNLSFNQVIASIDSTGVMKTISKGDSIYVELAFENLRPRYARGYLNDTILNSGLSDEKLDIFNRIESGNLQLHNASLQVEVENNIGVDLDIRVNDLKSINSRKSSVVSLSGSEINKPLHIVRAQDRGNATNVQGSFTSLTIDRSNSNLDDFINNLPDKIQYDVELHANPLGNTSFWNDFIYDSRFLNLNLVLDVPLELSASGLTLADTVDIDLSGQEFEKIKEGVLHAFFSNSFPVEAKVQINVLDQGGTIVDSLFITPAIISAAPVGSDGKTSAVTETRIDVPVDQSKIKNIFNGNKLNTRLVFDTKPELKELKIYDSYFIDFQLTADFVYGVE